MLKVLLFILILLFGIFLFIYGGYDDSPGAQLLGAVIGIAGIIGIIRNRRA